MIIEFVLRSWLLSLSDRYTVASLFLGRHLYRLLYKLILLCLWHGVRSVAWRCLDGVRSRHRALLRWGELGGTKKIHRARPMPLIGRAMWLSQVNECIHCVISLPADGVTGRYGLIVRTVTMLTLPFSTLPDPPVYMCISISYTSYLHGPFMVNRYQFSNQYYRL